MAENNGGESREEGGFAPGGLPKKLPTKKKAPVKKVLVNKVAKKEPLTPEQRHGMALLAAQSRNIKALREYVTPENINRRDAKGRTVAMVAAASGFAEGLNYLETFTDPPCDFSLLDKDGHTVRYHATAELKSRVVGLVFRSLVMNAAAAQFGRPVGWGDYVFLAKLLPGSRLVRDKAFLIEVVAKGSSLRVYRCMGGGYPSQYVPLPLAEVPTGMLDGYRGWNYAEGDAVVITLVM